MIEILAQVVGSLAVAFVAFGPSFLSATAKLSKPVHGKPGAPTHSRDLFGNAGAADDESTGEWLQVLQAKPADSAQPLRSIRRAAGVTFTRPVLFPETDLALLRFRSNMDKIVSDLGKPPTIRRTVPRRTAVVARPRPLFAGAR